MFDQLLGLLLLGLGLKSPSSAPVVRGDSTEQSVNSIGSSGAAGENEVEQEDDATGTSGAEVENELSDDDKREQLNGTQRLRKNKEREQKLKEVFVAREEKIKEALKERHETALKLHVQERAIFEKKLKTITDVQKRTLALKMDTKIPELNKRLTTNMTDRLTNMQKVLETSSLRLGEYKSANSAVDTSAIDSEISAAQARITSALGAVSNQSQKTYTTADFSSEENLGAAMKTLIAEFEADIKNVRTTVNTSKESVENVLKLIGALL